MKAAGQQLLRGQVCSMRPDGVPFCAGPAARTRPASWPAAYALTSRRSVTDCVRMRKQQMRCASKPLSLYVVGISVS